ncbi:MAG: hypothetical protein WAQ41_04295 [bacterium]|jgi:DNA-directed RNA polymerase subunit RPC12/RpoP|nr:hypothetical protein [Bacillota bacterium]HHW55655.1 hypothetical protein [Bacillota bacterium]
MLIDAAAALVMRCARCGKLVLISESLFNLRRAVKEVNCPCGGSLARLYLGRGGVLKLEIMCFICEDWHSVTLPLASFLRGDVEYFACPESSLELGLTGPPDLLRERMAAGDLELMGLTGDLNLEEYFVDPDIMFQVLNYLYELGRAGKIFCRCGQRMLEFNLYADRVDIHCNYCGNLLPVSASAREDLEYVRGLVELELDTNLYMPTNLGNRTNGKKNT